MLQRTSLILVVILLLMNIVSARPNFFPPKRWNGLGLPNKNVQIKKDMSIFKQSMLDGKLVLYHFYIINLI